MVLGSIVISPLSKLTTFPKQDAAKKCRLERKVLGDICVCVCVCVCVCINDKEVATAAKDQHGYVLMKFILGFT